MELEASYLQLVAFVCGDDERYELFGKKGCPLEEFVILDYMNPGLREFIDDLVGPRMADGWDFDSSGGRWTRKKLNTRQFPSK